MYNFLYMAALQINQTHFGSFFLKISLFQQFMNNIINISAFYCLNDL